MKEPVVIILILLLILKTWAQEPVYFNNIYQHNNNFAIGMTILETEGGYVGYGGTEDPNNIGQMLLLYKISPSGNELIWKPFGENYHDYYFGNVGGAMIKTSDGNFALAYHAQYNGIAYSSFVKLNNNLDTIWKRNYSTDNLWTMTMNCFQTNDNGFLLTGSVKPDEGEYWDFLIIKTDSSGNQEWYQTYGTDWSEHGENTIQTPDGRYLIGGYFWKPGYDHSMDAMIIKTDSLGNEEWTQYYGNPDVDDDIALIAMADDGNYLVATVHGEWIIAPSARTGRVSLIKIDNEGNTIWQKKIGPKRLNLWLKNFRKIISGYLITGFSYETDTATFQYYSGWMMKLDNNLDSVWYRDYIHEDENWESFFYDASPTSDNGYIAVGKARPDLGGSTNKMWIVKVDSLGCDTPGCNTGVNVNQLFSRDIGKLIVYPNPVKDILNIEYRPPERIIRAGLTKADLRSEIIVYDIFGRKVKEIEVPEGTETMMIDVIGLKKGMYFLKLKMNNWQSVASKFLKN